MKFAGVVDFGAYDNWDEEYLKDSISIFQEVYP